MSQFKRVSEVLVNQKVYEAPKRDITSVLNTDFLIWDFTLLQGSFGDFAVILCSDVKQSEKFTISTGSKVIIKKLNNLKNENLLPVIAKVVKVKRYYDII